MIWTGVGQVKMRELGINLNQFVFAFQEDKLKVLRGKASTFDSQYLLLKQWEEDTDFHNESFNCMHLWVQVWKLPNHWFSKAAGFKFKKVFWRGC